jgi:hypothetical protein
MVYISKKITLEVMRIFANVIHEQGEEKRGKCKIIREDGTLRVK